MKKTIFLVVFFLFLCIFPAFSEYKVGSLGFELPSDWRVNQEGMSFFSVAPDGEFYISGMVFYGLPDLETAKTGIMPLTRDMFSGFSILSEEKVGTYGKHPTLFITAKGYYKGLQSIIHMLVVQAGGQYSILQIFGTNNGWANNLSVVDNLYRSIQLSY